VTLVAFTIPDDPAQLPGWLESRLVAPDIGRLVAELAAAYPERGRAIPARQLLGDWYRKALADGLGGVPAGVLQQLLHHPRCLLELQEAVLTEGGAYWEEVAHRAEELTPAVERGRSALDAIFAAESGPLAPRADSVAAVCDPGATRPRETPASQRPATPLAERADHTPGQRPTRSYRNWALASSALAACLLLAVGYLTLTRPGPEVAGVSWGWAKPGGIPKQAQKPAEYLNSLAATSEEWFNKRPEDAAEVAKRISEFRAGCSRLIFSPHAALAQADRDWLVEKCRAWAKKLDDHLTELERGGDALKVRGDADDTIRKLQGALRERATKLV
jgi:hypothetical protein